MMTVREMWRRAPRGRKALVVIVIVVFLVVTVAAVIGWFWPKGVGSIRTVDTRAGVAEESGVDVEATVPGVEDAVEVLVGAFEFELDENGMALMPVTTNPAEAAAGAAAVAWNVNFEKVSRQEFFDTSIERMTHPSPDYVGPVGEVHTLYHWHRFEDKVREYAEPFEVMNDTVKTCGLLEHMATPCHWWRFANSTAYQEQLILGELSRGTPVLVMNEAEMAAWEPRHVIEIPEDVDSTPDTPGASLLQYWVVTEVQRGTEGLGLSDPYLEPAQFMIWCDAPADGGLCGVMGTVPRATFPNLWPTL